MPTVEGAVRVTLQTLAQRTQCPLDHPGTTDFRCLAVRGTVLHARRAVTILGVVEQGVIGSAMAETDFGTFDLIAAVMRVGELLRSLRRVIRKRQLHVPHLAIAILQCGWQGAAQADRLVPRRLATQVRGLRRFTQ